MYNGLGKALLDFETAVVAAEEKAEEGERDLHAILGPLEEAKAQYESVWHVANMLQLVTGELANVLASDVAHVAFLCTNLILRSQDFRYIDFLHKIFRVFLKYGPVFFLCFSF